MRLKQEADVRRLLQEKYNGRRNSEFNKDIIRLQRGEPLDYVIGWLPFLNCKIDLSLKPLIPRPETENWTEKAIAAISAVGRRVKIADIFSGSGCIGIAVLKNVKNSQVDFFELDKELIKQIKLNLQINKIPASRYRLIQGDAIKKLKNQYDFVLANPPYLATNRKAKVQAAVLKYEPRQALFAGPDGLFHIKKILQLAQSWLRPKGQLWLEFDSVQKKSIEDLLKKLKYQKWNFHQDQYRRWRYVQI